MILGANHACYISAYATSRFKELLCLIKKGLSLCILKKTLLRLLTLTCFLHKFNLMSIFFIAEERP